MAWEALGGVHEQTVFYPEHDRACRCARCVFRHPSGAVYKRINGDWTLIQTPNGEHLT